VRGRGEKKADGSGGQGEQALGRSRGGFGTKAHVRVNGLGLPTKFVLTPGQAADITQADALLDGTTAEVVIADRGYDKRALVERIEGLGAEAVIPTQKGRAEQRDIDREKYKDRNLVERFWGLAKQYRRVATRYEKKAQNFLAFLHVASVMILLR
jgi:transposase